MEEPWKKYQGYDRFFTVSKRFRNGVKQMECYPGADCNSDHVLLTFCIRIKSKRRINKTKTPRYNIELLRKSDDIRKKYSISIKNEFEVLGQSEDLNTQWEEIANILQESIEKIVPVKESKRNKKEMTEEIMNLIGDRRGGSV